MGGVLQYCRGKASAVVEPSCRGSCADRVGLQSGLWLRLDLAVRSVGGVAVNGVLAPFGMSRGHPQAIARKITGRLLLGSPSSTRMGAAADTDDEFGRIATGSVCVSNGRGGAQAFSS